MKRFKLLAGAGLAAVLTAGLAQPSAAQQQPNETNVTAQPGTARAEGKRIKFAFERTPWKAVFEWLTEQTGQPFISRNPPPTGTFNFISPAGKTHTLAEAIDILNEGLSASGFYLHRGPSSLTLLPADEPIDPTLVPLVKADELSTRARTEVVRVVVALKAAKAADIAPEVRKLLGPFGSVSTLAQRLVLQDSAGNLSRILRTLQELDGPARDGGPAEPPLLKSYAVPSGNAETLARVLQEAYRRDAEVKIVAVSRQSILVLAAPRVQAEVAQQLLASDPVAVEVVPLSTLPAQRTATTLKAMFGTGSGLFLEADAARNALILRGTRDQIQEIKAALVALGDSPTTGNLRVLNLERGSASVLAEALSEVIAQMRPNPIRVIAPGRKTDAKAAAKEPVAKDPKLPPLTLTAMGNKLIANCDDPQVLALVQELTRLLTQAGGEGDFEVIPLRHSDAAAVAKVLSEAFNPPDGRGETARVRIVADPGANALVVRATPLDLITIRQLLRTALDTDRDDGTAEMRNFTIALKNADGESVAKVLRELYRGVGVRAGGVSIGVDHRMNSLVIRCSPALFREMQQLVRELDDKAAPK